MTRYYALTERRTEEAKRIRREHAKKNGKDFSPRRGKEVVPRKDDIANCVTATQGIEQYVLEVEGGDEMPTKPIKLGGLWGNKQAGSCWDLNGIAPTIKTSSGGYSEPLIIENQTREDDDMSEVIRHDIQLQVNVRKHDVDIDALRQLLRSSKKSSGLTNRQIAEYMDRPITEVEHWFRTDDCFSIPEPSLWHDLKELINISTDEYDAQVTEFIEKPGVFEKANRFYDELGIAPTITSATADEKIIFNENQTREGDGVERFLVDDQGRTKKKLRPLDVSPTIRKEMHGNEPRVVEPQEWEESERKGDSAMDVTNETLTKEKRKKKPFKFVELFAGIGGVSFGFERVGGECVMAAEYDPQANTQFAQISYKALHPHVDLRGDVFELDAETVPEHDVLSFTTPCQSFSIAGKRGGFDDVRGTLYFEAMRIAAEKKPKVIFMENVKGLVGHDKGKTLDTIVKVANECGYRIDFNIMNSKFYEVPQNRERFFMIGVREDLIDNEPWNIEGETVVPKGKRRISKYDDVKTFNFDWPTSDKVTTRLRDILEPEVNKSFYLSEEKTDQLVRQLSTEHPVEVKGCSARTRSYADKPQQLEVRKDSVGNSITNVQKDAMILSVGNTNPSGRGMDGNVYSVNAGLAPTLTTNKGQGSKIIGELDVVGTSNPDGHKGNNMVYGADGVSPTILARDYKDAKRVLEDDPRYRIRKLTPLECFRLQGFSDESYHKLIDAGVSKTQLYKQIGNAVTVNVIESLGERLIGMDVL